jgi:hypothetical protein
MLVEGTVEPLDVDELVALVDHTAACTAGAATHIDAIVIADTAVATTLGR